MTTKNQQFRITNGPSKFDLMVALFVGAAKRRHHLTFTVGDNTLMDMARNIVRGTVEVVINEVSREDDSGESWCLNGYVPVAHSGLEQIRLYFHTTTRKGWLTFEPY